MISRALAPTLERVRDRDGGPRIAALAAIVFLGVVPVLTMLALFASAAQDDAVATDFRQFYRAAEAILDGESPYLERAEPLAAWGGPYPYPPLPALVAAPLTILPIDAAGLLVMVVLLGVALATLAVLGVRDWRCYGVVLLWPSTISAIQTGNVTLWLGLGAALAWRYRDRAFAPALAVGATLAVKLFLWPLAVWLAASRRVASGVLAVVVGGVLLVASWAVLGFAGMTDYPDLVRRLEDAVGEDSYTAYIVGLDAGLPPSLARVLWLGLGGAVLAAVVWGGRRGDERSAFVLAVAASLALTPIVWLHYFALLAVVVAVAQPRLGALWFVPLAMVVTPGSGHPSPFETSATLLIAAVTVGLAVRECRRQAVDVDVRGARSPAVPGARPA